MDEIMMLLWLHNIEMVIRKHEYNSQLIVVKFLKNRWTCGPYQRCKVIEINVNELIEGKVTYVEYLHRSLLEFVKELNYE